MGWEGMAGKDGALCNMGGFGGVELKTQLFFPSHLSPAPSVVPSAHFTYTGVFPPLPPSFYVSSLLPILHMFSFRVSPSITFLKG